ncbi:MAG: hypothetical protein IPK02_08070 [Candidatus Accumulibacter sp.]|uniref:Uncharacterized protein n=1 Tax=Candidatus Accumulibacter affinis TaxID=2954384 RepID=A0A935T9U0_9PROT|nr:hypothetical protein [Candidatus Accumulibacter affinis]
MDPAQGVDQHIELPGVIADDRQIGATPCLTTVLEQDAFGHQANMARIGDGLLSQDRLPGGLTPSTPPVPAR